MAYRFLRPSMAAAAAVVSLAAGMAHAGGAAAASLHHAAPAASSGLAPTPPMGWNGYNRYHTAVTEAIVKRNAKALVSSGLAAGGYRYVNLDGGWDLLQRDASGNLQADPAKFPDGIKALAGYVHSLGLKFGIYESAGTSNCAGTSAGGYIPVGQPRSAGGYSGNTSHYAHDAATFAAWGVDYIKLDFCNVPWSNWPSLTTEQVAQMLAGQFSQAIGATGRPMLLDVNDASGARNHDQDWTWAKAAGAQEWRVCSDISDTYNSMLNHIFGPASGHSYDLELYRYAGPNGWNDPDMLEVGNGGMTGTEDRSEFSLWAEEAAPLLAGNELTAMSSTTRTILGNAEVIAVDQDPLGRQGHAIATGSGHYVLVKPLADGSVAVLLFNKNSTSAYLSTTAAKAGLPTAASYTLRNLWTHSTSTTAGSIRAKVAAHGVVMFRVTAG